MKDGSLSIVKWLAVVLLLSISACLPLTNRTSYNTFNIMPVSVSAADSLNPEIMFSLNRELTSKVYPFVSYLGENGDFAFSVQLFGSGAKKYRSFVLNSMRIESGGKVHFATLDSTFIEFQSFRESDNNRYYKSKYIVALADTVKKPTIRVEYMLVTHNNRREQYSFVRPLYINRYRGLGWY